MEEAYIVAIGRTAGGRRNGKLSRWHPADLGAAALNSVVERAQVDPKDIDDVVFGCVSQVGQQSLNIARTVVLSAGLPETVPGTTIDRQCGSSQQALHFAAQAVMSGTMDVVLAGGVESMTRVPLGTAFGLALEAGMGGPQGEGQAARYGGVRSTQFDGAELLARKHDISREAMDAFALQSHRRAAAAVAAGAFEREIVPVAARTLAGDSEGQGEPHSVDEGIRFEASRDGLAALKTLREDGRVTAGTSSQICDGASALLVVNRAGLDKVGVEPLARIHQMTVLGGDPIVMLETPIAATRLALARAGMSIADIELYEVNEAFACVPMAWAKALGADPARMNVHGGAIALGHPLGASGTKLMSTLIAALHRTGGRYGLQTMCEGGGLANVTVVERL